MFNCFLSLFVSVEISDAYVNVFSYYTVKQRLQFMTFLYSYKRTICATKTVIIYCAGTRRVLGINVTTRVHNCLIL
jgi:hypothetical protein